MPSSSPEQKRFMYTVLAYKLGKTKDVSKDVKDAAHSMSQNQIEDFLNEENLKDEDVLDESTSFGVFGVGGFPATPVAFAKNKKNWRFGNSLPNEGAKIVEPNTKTHTQGINAYKTKKLSESSTYKYHKDIRKDDHYELLRMINPDILLESIENSTKALKPHNIMVLSVNDGKNIGDVIGSEPSVLDTKFYVDIEGDEFEGEYEIKIPISDFVQYILDNYDYSDRYKLNTRSGLEDAFANIVHDIQNHYLDSPLEHYIIDNFTKATQSETSSSVDSNIEENTVNEHHIESREGITEFILNHTNDYQEEQLNNMSYDDLYKIYLDIESNVDFVHPETQPIAGDDSNKQIIVGGLEEENFYGKTPDKLEKGKTYVWTGGAELQDVVYLGKSWENPTIKAGSSVGKGFLFQWPDGSYFELGRGTIKEDIIEKEDEETDLNEEGTETKLKPFEEANAKLAETMKAVDGKEVNDYLVAVHNAIASKYDNEVADTLLQYDIDNKTIDTSRKEGKTPEETTEILINKYKQIMNEEAKPASLTRLDRIKKENEKNEKDAFKDLNKGIQDGVKNVEEGGEFKYDFDKDSLTKDEIPHYQQDTEPLANFVDMNRGRLATDLDFDYEPTKEYIQKNYKDNLGEEGYKKFKEKVKLRRLEKLHQRNVETEINDKDSKNRINIKPNVNESMEDNAKFKITGYFKNKYGEKKFITVNSTDVKEVGSLNEDTNYSELSFNGLGNNYSSTIEKGDFVKLNENKEAIANYKFYVNFVDNSVVKVKSDNKTIISESTNITKSDLKKQKNEFMKLVNGGKKQK